MRTERGGRGIGVASGCTHSEVEVNYFSPALGKNLVMLETRGKKVAFFTPLAKNESSSDRKVWGEKKSNNGRSLRISTHVDRI